jgi:hypothetical protein
VDDEGLRNLGLCTALTSCKKLPEKKNCQAVFSTIFFFLEGKISQQGAYGLKSREESIAVTRDLDFCGLMRWTASSSRLLQQAKAE